MLIQIIRKLVGKLKKVDFLAKESPAFTLPEIIISFSVLVLVITSATGILVTVIRSNSDNVNSLVANGLAQEGLEAIRFIRDSNVVLGLGFDGATKENLPSPKWGAKLYEDNQVKFFAVDWNKNVSNEPCDKNIIADCLPLNLRALNESKLDNLRNSVDTLIYKNAKSASAPVSDKAGYYYQINLATDKDQATAYHRFIRVEPIASGSDPKSPVDKLRVSSVVSWTGENDLAREVVLSTELTNWK